MRKKVSMTDVAERAGVSRTTVSFVLNGRMDMQIPEETRSRVLAIARELNYRPNTLARSLVSGRTNTIGIITPISSGSTFLSNIILGIETHFEQDGYRILIVHSRPASFRDFKGSSKKSAQLGQFLLEHQVEGIIHIGGGHKYDPVEDLVKLALAERVPIVLVDDEGPESVEDVLSDDFEGAHSAVAHLVKLGHKNIVHLSHGKDRKPSQSRLRGYQTAMREYGLKKHARVISVFTPDEVALAVEALLDEPQKVSAIFTANDFIASVVTKVAAQRGIRMPDDLALVGYANEQISELLDVTSVDQSPLMMGQRAAERILKQIKNPGSPPEKSRIPTRLMVRHSTVGVR